MAEKVFNIEIDDTWLGNDIVIYNDYVGPC